MILFSAGFKKKSLRCSFFQHAEILVESRCVGFISAVDVPSHQAIFLENHFSLFLFPMVCVYRMSVKKKEASSPRLRYFALLYNHFLLIPVINLQSRHGHVHLYIYMRGLYTTPCQFFFGFRGIFVARPFLPTLIAYSRERKRLLDSIQQKKSHIDVGKMPQKDNH
jgi:hypothetical protein